MRKTIYVHELIEEVNRINRESSLTPEHRAGCNLLLEYFLRKTGHYKGFGYYTQSELTGPAKEAGCVGGIIWGNNPETGERDNRFNQYPDESRRFYYIG